MKIYSLVLAAGLLVMTLPAATADHNVCHGAGDIQFPFGLGGVDDPFTGLDGIFVCIGTEAVGVDPDVYTGPSFGATVRVLTCSGLGCGEVLSNTGVVIDSGGVLRICIDNPACPP